MSYDKKAMERTNRYKKEKRDKLTIDMQKGKKEMYRAYAKQKGLSLTALITSLIEKDMSLNDLKLNDTENNKNE